MAYRKMYDSVTVGNLPVNADNLYAGYVGGLYPTLIPIMQRFPHARVVSIAVNASQSAQVLDVETGGSPCILKLVLRTMPVPVRFFTSCRSFP